MAPDPHDLLRELHQAVYGNTWARPDSPEETWRELIRKVEAWRKAAYPKLTPEMPAWFEPFARGCAQGLEKGRNDALADAVGLARFIRGRGVIKPDDEHEAVIAGHRLGCESVAEHIEMMRRGFRLHDNSCPACKWIDERMQEKTR